MKAFILYFEKNWIGARGRYGTRKKPTYEIKIWNKYEEIIDEDFVLTNNGNEVFNSSWAPSIPKSATVWTVILEFQRREALARAEHNEHLRGLTKAHNSSRDRLHKQRMEELHNICKNINLFKTVLNALKST